MNLLTKELSISKVNASLLSLENDFKNKIKDTDVGTLSEKLEAEISARKTADSNLQDNYDKAIASVSDKQDKVDNVFDSNIACLEGATDNIQDTLDSLEEKKQDMLTAGANVSLDNNIVSVKIEPMRFKGVKPTYDDLPTEAENGDVWLVQENSSNYCYTDSGWVFAGNTSIDFSELLSTCLLAAHPVGSIYISSDSADPSTLFGGTWKRLYNQFLFAASTDHPLNEEGGEERHTLTVSEIPSHVHSTKYTGTTVIGCTSYATNSGVQFPAGTPYGSMAVGTGSTGGGQGHNNMPPYVCKYMWERIA